MNRIERTTPATPAGYQQIAGLVAATKLTIPNGGPKWALVQAVTQSVRWRDDGTSPTAAIGMLLAAGDDMFISTTQLAKMEFIQTAATAELNVSYYN